MDALQSIKRMEKAIEAEHNPFTRWRMRKELARTIKMMEENNALTS